MNKKICFWVDQETIDILEQLKQELKISKADIVRMSIAKFKNYVEKVNK